MFAPDLTININELNNESNMITLTTEAHLAFSAFEWVVDCKEVNEEVMRIMGGKCEDFIQHI